MITQLEEHNDAIAQVECSRHQGCCDAPVIVNQFGNKSCICMRCAQKCHGCVGSYIPRDLEVRKKTEVGEEMDTLTEKDS